MLEVLDTSVVVVLTGEERATEVGRVNVGKREVVGVPATEAEVEPSNACDSSVDGDNLLVMTPVHGHLASEVIGMPDAGDCESRIVSRRRSSDRASHRRLTVLVHILEVMLGVRRRERHALGHLLVDHDQNLDTLLGFAQEDSVEAHVVVLRGHPPKEQLGSEPPGVGE